MFSLVPNIFSFKYKDDIMIRGGLLSKKACWVMTQVYEEEI